MTFSPTPMLNCSWCVARQRSSRRGVTGVAPLLHWNVCDWYWNTLSGSTLAAKLRDKCRSSSISASRQCQVVQTFIATCYGGWGNIHIRDWLSRTYSVDILKQIQVQIRVNKSLNAITDRKEQYQLGHLDKLTIKRLCTSSDKNQIISASMRTQIEVGDWSTWTAISRDEATISTWKCLMKEVSPLHSCCILTWYDMCSYSYISTGIVRPLLHRFTLANIVAKSFTSTGFTNQDMSLGQGQPWTLIERQTWALIR